MTSTPGNQVDSVIQCGYCMSPDGSHLFRTNDIFDVKYSICKCNNCNAIFLSPRPTEEELSRAYAEDYYGSNDRKFSFAPVEKAVDYFRGQRARKLSRKLPEHATVLDIGCGNGNFLRYLLRFGKFKIHGTELEGNSAKRAAEVDGINLHTGSLGSLDFTNDQFDAVTLFHVFEHLQHPADDLEKIRRVLKNNGTLMMSFPNIGSVQAAIFKGKWLHLDPPRHLFFFKRRDFVRLMKTYGFNLISQSTVSAEQNPFGAIQSTLNLFCARRDVLFEHLKGNRNYGNCSSLSLFFQKVFFITFFPFFLCSDLIVGIFRAGATISFTFALKKD